MQSEIWRCTAQINERERARASGNARLRPVVLNSQLRLFVLNSASYVGQAGRLRRASRERRWAEWTWWTQSTEWTSAWPTRVHARFRSLALVHVRCFVRWSQSSSSNTRMTGFSWKRNAQVAIFVLSWTFDSFAIQSATSWSLAPVATKVLNFSESI
jgi:hypothetical protein